MTRIMYDSVTVSAIPSDARAVAGYVDGDWPTFHLLGRFKANRLSIAVHSDADAACLDIEAGDATAGQAAGWVARQINRGQKTPVLYASRDTLPAVLRELRAAGIPRRQVRVWSAHYTDQPHICAPGSCGAAFTADATQWTDKALGRNLDESLLSDSFFPKAPTHRKRRLRVAKAKPHPKVQGSTGGGALGVAIAAALHAAHVHITPAEASAISAFLALVAGWLTPSGKR